MERAGIPVPVQSITTQHPKSPMTQGHKTETTATTLLRAATKEGSMSMLERNHLSNSYVCKEQSQNSLKIHWHKNLHPDLWWPLKNLVVPTTQKWARGCCISVVLVVKNRRRCSLAGTLINSMLIDPREYGVRASSGCAHGY